MGGMLGDVLSILLLCLVLAQFVALYLIYQRLSGAIVRAGAAQAAQADNTILQIESLLALYAEIRPEHGLPPMRGWAASPDFLRALAAQIGDGTPETVVECSSGVSTLVAAACLRRAGRGRVLSLEHDPVYAEKTRRLLRVHGLEAHAEVIDAPLVELALPGWQGQWYDASRLPAGLSIDLLVVDGPPWFSAELARYPAFPVLRDRLAPAARLLLDDADRVDERTIVERWLAAAPALTRRDAPACEKGCALLVWQGRAA